MNRTRKIDLLLETQSLITDIKNEIGSYEFLLKILIDLVAQLEKEDISNLQSCLSAIYRMTTDDASFEKSPIGQRLLRLVALFHV